VRLIDPPLGEGRPVLVPPLAMVVAAHRAAGHPGEMALCERCAAAFTVALAQGGVRDGSAGGRA
jgi:hypothetical protein